MVLGTIIENIKSFFQKEETLLKEPKKAPEIASEALGTERKDSASQSNASSETTKVVDKHLPDTELPFSSSDLRSALHKESSQKPQTSPEPTSNQPSSRQSSRVPEPEYTEIDEDAVKEFEAMLMSHDSNNASQDVSNTAASTSVRNTSQLSDNGFFSSFKEFIEEGKLDPKHLDGDLLHKMRSFHERMRDGKEPILHKDAANRALKRRLEELQGLEHEWERLYHQSQDVERSMVHVEEEIDERTQALKTLLAESKQLSVAAREVPEGQEFRLANGESVSSVGALFRVLRREPWLFGRHVSGSRNDFALWLESACDLPDLATKVRDAKSHDALISLLKP